MPGLTHLAIAVGSAADWQRWGDAVIERATRWGNEVAQRGIPWLTVRPFGSVERAGAGHHAGQPGRAVLDVGGCTVIIDPAMDGRERLVDVLRAAGRQGTMSDTDVSARLNAPAPGDPDLVVVCGPDTRLPASMAWELAYAELVFADVAVDRFTSEVLHAAIDQFDQRHRRFGGLD